MKASLTIVFFLIVSSLTSQIYIVKYDSVFTAKCSRSLTYRQMVESQNFEVIASNYTPGAIVIQVDMMMIFGVGGEAFIEEVKDVDGKLVFISKFNDKTHVVTLQNNLNGGTDLVMEYDLSNEEKCVVYFPNVNPMN